jgi:hypothetical protein
MLPHCYFKVEVKMDLQTAYRKAVLEQYNKAKGAGKRHQLDEGRVNRAFGLVMSSAFCAKMRQYGTTYRSCYCPDAENRTAFCKHRLAFIMNWRAIQQVSQLIADGKVEINDDPLAY